MNFLRKKSDDDLILEGEAQAHAMIDEPYGVVDMCPRVVDALADNAARNCVSHPDREARLRSYGRLQAYLVYFLFVLGESSKRSVTGEVSERLRLADEACLAAEASRA